MKSRVALSTILASTLLATTGAAWADDEPADSEAKEGEAAEGEAEAAKAPVTEEAPAATSRWPRANVARPLTLPKGLANLGATFNAAAGFDVLGFGLNAGYGVSDDLEVRLGYAFTVDPGEAKGPLSFGLGYKLLRGAAGGKLEVIGRANTGYDFLAEGLSPLGIGAQVQYALSDKLAVYTPGNQIVIALEETPGAAGADATRPMYLSLPVGVGYQVSPVMWAQLDTTLANIELKDSASAYLFADMIPVTASVLYNVKPAIDINVGLGFADLKNNAGDNFLAFVGVQYYAGKL